MEVYRYKAMNDEGRLLHGRADAVNPADLEVRLGHMGLDLVNFEQMKKRGRAGSRSIKRIDVITFCFHLEHLIHAGVPILEGLADLRDTTDNKRLREIISAMIESIEGGRTLSGAMQDFPYVFNAVFIALIQAGEASGSLSAVLAKIIEHLKWQDEQAALTKRLLLYPAFVGVVMVAVVAFLMIGVVPQMVQLLRTMGEELPVLTQVLISGSNFFQAHWLALLTVPLVLLAALYGFLRSNERFHTWFDGWVLRLPVLGVLLKKIIMARFANFFAIMYASGIPVLECLRSCENIAGNRAVRAAVHDAGLQIADGGGISASFESTNLFPPLVIRMLRVGENTGALETALENVSYFYTRDVHEGIDRMQKLLLPVLTVGLGLFLLVVIIAVFKPIYDLVIQNAI